MDYRRILAAGLLFMVGACTLKAGGNTVDAAIDATPAFDASPDATGPINLFFEAEDAVLVAPMVATADAAASGGFYITSPSSDVGTATLAFDLPAAGTFYLWLRVYAADTASDSIYYAMDGETDINLYVNTKLSWFWEDAVAPYDLTAGSHELVFRTRESGLQFDQLLITDDPSIPPAVLP